LFVYFVLRIVLPRSQLSNVNKFVFKYGKYHKFACLLEVIKLYVHVQSVFERNYTTPYQSEHILGINMCANLFYKSRNTLTSTSISKHIFHICFMFIPCSLNNKYLLYILTYTQISNVNLYLITPTCFGVNTPSSGSLELS